MPADGKDKPIREAVEACIAKAEDILEDNQGGVRALFAVYTDEDTTSVHAVGHAIALDAVYQKTILHIIRTAIAQLANTSPHPHMEGGGL